VVEDVDKVFLQRRFGENDGYLYEYRWIDDYFLQDLGPELEPYAARFEPRTHETASMFELFQPIRDLVRAVNEAEQSTLDTALAPHLDLRLLITQLAAENFLSEWDGFLGYAGLSNFYLYRSGDTGVARLIPWDKDNTFRSLDTPPWDGFEVNVLGRKVRANPRLRQAYLQRLLEAAALGESLEADVLAAYAQIRAAALADPLKPTTNEGFEQAVADVRAFARQRSAVVRGFVNGTAPSRYRPARTRE
jgi:spore coat protein CotH